MSELFDDISRIVGSPIPRRRAIKAIGGALIGALLGASVFKSVSSARQGSSCCQGPGGYCFFEGQEVFCDPRQPWTQEKCVAAGFEWRVDHSCCSDGHICPSNGVCCGVTCCDANSVCLGDECCPANRACGNFCCPSGSVCVNGACCPTQRVCTDPATNQTICCASGRCCGGTKCCSSGTCTSDGMNCGSSSGNPITVSPAR